MPGLEYSHPITWWYSNPLNVRVWYTLWLYDILKHGNVDWTIFIRGFEHCNNHSILEFWKKTRMYFIESTMYPKPDSVYLDSDEIL